MASSQTKFWTASSGTVTRLHKSNGAKQGDGQSKRLYVGRIGDYTYHSFLKFAVDWTGVGKVLKATLILYTDDFLGQNDHPATHPAIRVRRLTGAFTEGNNIDGTFDSSDYHPGVTTASGEVKSSMTPEIDGINRIDITGIVNLWAPSTVKRSTGGSGGGIKALGIGLTPYTTETQTEYDWSGWSENASDALLRPTIELVYEYGLTTPNVPTSLTPSGVVASVASFQGDFSDPRSTDQLRFSQVQVYTAAVTASGQTITLNGGSKVYDVRLPESNTSILNDRFDHIPDNMHLRRNTNYKWRARVTDNEGQVSSWTALVTFSVTNTIPNAPTLSPGDGASFSTLDGVLFRGGTFTDPDAGDTLLAYEVQLSAYAEGDSHWLDDEFILWNTGKRYTASGATSWSTPYGGNSLSAGVYHWRARQFDNHQGVSDWAYASLTVTVDFVSTPETAATSIQMRPRAPWRIVIKAMGTNRGPGTTVAVLEDAMNVGASILYNSPGEAHWTLGAFHPQLSVIEPRQTHYAIEFRQGDGWREVFAGLVMDFDATATDVVFYGVDYLGLLDFLADEKYKSSNPDADYTKGGSKYSAKAIGTIVYDQLSRARNLSNSPVKFIAQAQLSATLATMMPATVTVYSTFAPTLNFVTGLIDSHRAGTGKRTRLSVQRTTGGTYQFVVTDDPGQARDNLRLRYGELVQGFRVVPFGSGWGTRVAAVGRDKSGVKVRYNSVVTPGISEDTWGRWMLPQFFDGISDDSDLARRARQFITAASMLGKQVGLGLRSGVLQPRDGFDLLDKFPVDIEFGSVDTTAFGHDGYWVAVGITWQAKAKGEQTTTLTLQPQESGSAPSSDLLVSVPASTQAEWQLGWTPPNPLTASSKYWLDQNTGIVYIRGDGTLVAAGITGSV